MIGRCGGGGAFWYPWFGMNPPGVGGIPFIPFIIAAGCCGVGAVKSCGGKG